MKEKRNQIDPASAYDNAEIVSWSEKYSTGIALIDSQHKELVNLTNRLHRACLSGSGIAETVFSDAMREMVTYVRFHFGAEQELLKRLKYPDCHNHKKQHDTLIKDILDAVKDYNEGKKFVPNHFVRTLRDWVFGHIAVYDKLYTSYVAVQKKKGLITDQQING